MQSTGSFAALKMAAALSLGGLAAKRCFSGFSKAPVVLAGEEERNRHGLVSK